MEFNNEAEKVQSQLIVENTDPKPEKIERGNGENDRPHKQQPYQHDTGDDGAPNIPGPGELPDQQKVGEDIDEDTYEKDHNDSEK